MPQAKPIDRPGVNTDVANRSPQIEPPDLLDAAERGYERFDEELPALSLYGWAMQHLDHEPGEWDETSVHLSDYRYSLPPEEGGCDRQLFHRLRQDDASDPTLWMRMMWDQGFALQIRFSWLLCQGLPEPWSLEAVEMDVSRGLPGDDVGSCDLVLSAPGRILGVEMKTQRGRAFRYLDEPKPSHVIQSEGEAYALKAIFPGKEVDHRLVYLDREGQNTPLVFPTDTDLEAEKRVRDASAYANDIGRGAETDKEPPEPLSAEIKVRENKGPDSIYLEQPWVCEYCDYYGESCEGALPQYLTENGIVAKGDHTKPESLDIKADPEIADEVEMEIARAAQAGNVKTK